ncbi:MAG: orotidine-5'-phosphate decarboxylase [Candidatus Vogelbacteria bacterium]|nr:orotidine-5'-phosphate decarboxylase [Candidatus Vogelbacteria bacterium]
MLENQWSRGNFVCVGLDSEFGKIPESEHIRGNNYGVNIARTIAAFNRAIVKATGGFVCAYKLNTAFYEANGDEGIGALQRTIADIHAIAPDVPVILDAKRADIGNTNAGYVDAAFGFLRADAITVHPYLGAEALQPFLARAEKGIIVLCHTSNPGAGEFQDREVVLTFDELSTVVGDADLANYLIGEMGWSYPTGGYRIPMYQYVALRVSRHWNRSDNCAVVVGATYPEKLRAVRRIVGDIPILIPGIGAQGGDVEKIVSAGKNNCGQGMIINSSRGIIFASQGADFAKAARRETERLHDSIIRCLNHTGN